MNLLDYLLGSEQKRDLKSDLGLLILRVAAGSFMAFGHGINKMPPPERFVEGVSAMGFPMPLFFAWSAGLSEFIGALCLALGLFVRPSALFLMITMGVAGFVAHANDPFQNKEMSLLYLSIATMLLLSGGGRWSVDALIRRRVAKL